jgi:hypothetical protein
MIQQLSAKPRTQDLQQAMVQQTSTNTQNSGEFRSMLLKTAQSAKTGFPAETSDSSSVPKAVSKDRPDEDSPPSLSGDSTQPVLSQALLLAVQQTAAGEAPSVSAPNVNTQTQQSVPSAVPVVTESLQVQQNVPTVSPTAAESLQVQQSVPTGAPAATESLQAQQTPSEVFAETPQAVQAPAQIIPAAQTTQRAQTVSETATAVKSEHPEQTIQTLQTSPQASETNAKIQQSITEAPAEAELPAETEQAASEQTSVVLTEPIANTEEAEFTVFQKEQPLDAEGQTANTEEPVPSQKEEKDTSAEKTPALTSRQASVPYSSEKVIVQISDTPAAAKAPVTNQVADAVVQHLKAGKQQFQVDLYPQVLGKVSVKLVAENGMLTIEIAAANPKTQSLLASSSGEIRSLLQASTGQTVEVTAQQPNAQQYTDQNSAGQQQQEQSSAQQQQQQEEAERRRAAAIWYASNSLGFSAADFLTMLQTTAVS